MSGNPVDMPDSQTFTLRDKRYDNASLEFRQTTMYPDRLAKSESVFEGAHVPQEDTNGEKSDAKKQAATKKGSDKKKRGILEVCSEECLRIEFAELLTEPQNKYIPSLHGWRDWGQNNEWIDPDGARTEAVEAVEDRIKCLPTKTFGPPLP